MKNKITKFLTILSIIFISFFINQNKAEATECEYALIPPYINENSIATVLQVEYTYYHGTFHSQQKLTDAKITSFTLKCNDNTNDAAGNTCDVYANYESDVKGLGKSTKFTFYNFNGTCNDKYLKLTDNTLVSSNANQYKNSLLKMYANKVQSNNIYGYITIKGNNKYSSSGTGNANYKVNLSNYLTDVSNYGGIAFVNKNSASNYPSVRLREFNTKMKERNHENEIASFPIDQNSKNEKTYTKDYYEATKSKWYTYMRNSINKNDDRGDSIRRPLFLNWWDNVNRYVFEDDLELFKSYFVYLYEGQTDVMSENDYSHYLGAINALLDYEDYSGDEDCLTSDPCSSFCNTSASNYVCSGPSYTQCTAHSQQYQSCKNAYNSCKNVPASNYDSCMSGHMGLDAYNSLKQNNSSMRDELHQMQDDAIDRIADELHGVKAPDLDVDFEPYEVTCDDVAIFHTFYVILEIMAPILVILFGTIDYAKAVMASDVEKMQKAKKNFPKRLGLLLLFIFVPLLVSFLIGEFSSTNSSLMYCIINGG